MTRNATFGALVFAVLLVTTGLSGAVGAAPAGSSASAATSPAPLAQETTTTQSNETANESANVTFDDQSVENSSLVVSEANLSAGGYVVVFAQNGTVLGNTSYLEPGTHENLTVNLTTPLSRSQVVIAAPHLDTNDNQTFDFNATQAQQAGAENATDRPYLQANGLPVSSVAFVTVGNESRRSTTTASRVAPTE
ncbi:DUF7282 domain-containing protein [Halorussus ruber]|uniref:DUF7282 domain-containing protein n=1 Tax=Halorussus ruber TaxID=1126238 RepID=UPI001092CC3B|nr:hypothetical protein [Halorussus ruber]